MLLCFPFTSQHTTIRLHIYPLRPGHYPLSSLHPRLSATVSTMASGGAGAVDYAACATGSTDPQDKTLVIREVTDGIVTFSKPFVSV